MTSTHYIIWLVGGYVLVFLLSVIALFRWRVHQRRERPPENFPPARLDLPRRGGLIPIADFGVRISDCLVNFPMSRKRPSPQDRKSDAYVYDHYTSASAGTCAA